MALPSPPLLLITDRRLARQPLEEVVAAAVDGGCRWVSLREKDLPADERLALLRRLIAIGRRAGAVVTVHDDVEAALAAGADGVHLPSHGSPAEVRHRLGAAALLGWSTHRPDETVGLTACDYVTLSPIFLTASKPGYGPALGIAAVEQVRHFSAIPVIALGGVTAATAPACRDAGAAGIAVMGGIMAAADPATAAADIIAAFGR